MSAFHQVWVLDGQSHQCPNDVIDEIERLWADYELGNDNCYMAWHDFMSDRYPVIKAYIKEYVSAGTEVLIHWWW